MIRNTLACLAIFAAAGFANADEKDEWKTLNGTWSIEKFVFMGTDGTEMVKGSTLKMTDGKYTVVIGGAEADKGTLKIDPSKKPKRITVVSEEGLNKGKTLESIYDLDGDKLTVCYALEGKDPPKAFESKEGTMTLLIVYKREKK